MPVNTSCRWYLTRQGKRTSQERTAVDVLRLVVLKLDVEAVFNAHLHLDGRVHVRVLEENNKVHMNAIVPGVSQSETST